MEKKVVKLTRDDVDFEVRKIFKNFKFMSMVQPVNGEKPIVVAVMKGGEYFARKVATKYDLPLEFIECKSYKNKELGDTIDIMHIPISLFEEKRPIIFVDDIYETGTTKKALQRIFPNSKFIVLYKKTTDDVVDTYGDVLAKDIWFEFFWENEVE
jgi:hypoxanthine-guanine phosphoribosyltransferase